MLGLYLFKGLGAYFSTYLMTDVGQRVVRDVRNQLFRHILNQSAGFFSRRTSGQLMSGITNDVNQIQQAVSETAGDLVREGLSVVGFAGLMFYYDPKLALVVVTGAPIVLYPLVRLGQRVRRTSRRVQEELAHLSHVTAEAFTGHRIVKAFGAEAQEGSRFQAASQRLYRTSLKVTSTVSILPPLMEFLGGVAVVGLIWYGSNRIGADGGMTQGDFLAFVVAAFMMYGPIKKLSRVNTNLQQAIAASERIFELLDTHSEVEERPGAGMLEPLRDGIEFRNVTFTYEDGSGRYVLRDVSFPVTAGQVIAIVGLSGAGKTTLVNLIPRFFDVSSGAILMDGVDIRDVTLKSLRAQIGIVTQETVLFDESIASNIAYGTPGATRAQIEAAARAAHAHEFIVTLPEQVRHLDWRTRAAAVGRTAAAAGDRPRAAEELADPDPRRSDVVARRRVRASGAGCAREPDARPDVVRHRAPALDRAARRRDHRARARTRRRDRTSRRAAGEAGRRLCEAVRAADLRASAGRGHGHHS